MNIFTLESKEAHRSMRKKCKESLIVRKTLLCFVLVKRNKKVTYNRKTQKYNDLNSKLMHLKIEEKILSLENLTQLKRLFKVQLH